MTEDLDLDLDPNWARDLFERTRGAGEPVWAVDAAALARAGDRRRRFRTARAGGGLAGAVTLTVAVAVGLGAGSSDAGSLPGPGGAWGNRPLADVFDYATYGATYEPGGNYVAAPVASDVATVLARMDPSLTHIAAVKASSRPHIVAAGDARAKTAELHMGSTWVDSDAPRRAGVLSFEFAPVHDLAQMPQEAEYDTSQLALPCSLPFGGAVRAATSTTTPPPTPAQWSSCALSHQPDGSTIGSAVARIGTGTVTVAVREFADGEVFSVVAQDYWELSYPEVQVADPTTVLQPTPWNQGSLVAALADPAIQSGWG